MSEQIKIAIKGLVRFSFPAEGGFTLSSKNPGETERTLYDPARLNRRFAYFETLALPSLIQQDDADFVTGILVGETLPDAARARLEGLLAGHDNLQIVTLPAMNHIQAVKQSFEALPQPADTTHVATFRLDDDDAMHLGTTGRVRTLAEGILPLRLHADPFCIAFNRGFYLDTSDRETPLRECYERAPLGVGMALVTGHDTGQNVFSRNHRAIAQFYDTYTEVNRPMFVRSVHQDNDSAAVPTGRTREWKEKRLRHYLRNAFGLDYDTVRAL